MATIISNIRQQYIGSNQWHQQFPWFGAGHLLEAAAQKNSEGFGAASQKAAIYFNDIQRLHWLLHQEDLDVATILSGFNLENEETISTDEEIFAAKSLDEKDLEDHANPDADTELQTDTDNLPDSMNAETAGEEADNQPIQLEDIEGPETITVKLEEEIMEPGAATMVSDTGPDDQIFKLKPANELLPVETDEEQGQPGEDDMELPTEPDRTKTENETFVADHLDAVVSEIFELDNKGIATAEVYPVARDVEEKTEAPEPLQESLQNETGDEAHIEYADRGETIDTNKKETDIVCGDGVVVELTEVVEMQQSWQDDSYDPDDTDGPEETKRLEPKLVSVMDIAAEKFESTTISQSLAEASKQFKEDNKEEELVIATEPYHTVDYFASQGIKLEMEPKADDKFGQQLKSFTSWLKQMKRLPATRMAEKEHDPLVENSASRSLQEGDVVTESMAEVLMKQGKEQQAVEVWQKLSLLHPEKSHYFATLIEKTKV